jgi:hypothetical protein
MFRTKIAFRIATFFNADFTEEFVPQEKKTFLFIPYWEDLTQKRYDNKDDALKLIELRKGADFIYID